MPLQALKGGNLGTLGFWIVPFYGLYELLASYPVEINTFINIILHYIIPERVGKNKMKQTNKQTNKNSDGETLNNSPKETDGHGNILAKLSWVEFQDFVTNAGMWCKGDKIQVYNKEGCVSLLVFLLRMGNQEKWGVFKMDIQDEKTLLLYQQQIKEIEEIEPLIERLERATLLNDERLEEVWSCLMAIKMELKANCEELKK